MSRAWCGSGFSGAAGVDEGFDAEREEDHGDRAHGELHRDGEWALGCSVDEGAELREAHAEAAGGSEQAEEGGDVHDVHAGIREDFREDAAEEDGRAEECGNERGDTLRTGADIGSETECAEKDSKSDGDGMHKVGRVACGSASGKPEWVTKTFVAARGWVRAGWSA